MEQRTVNIILCCKDHGKGKNYAERIANYMAKECDVAPDRYSVTDIYNLLNEAAKDFVRSSKEGAVAFAEKVLHYTETHHALYIREMNKTAEQDGVIKMFADLYADVFDMMPARQVNSGLNDTQCINGFTEEAIETGLKFLEE